MLANASPRGHTRYEETRPKGGFFYASIKRQVIRILTPCRRSLANLEAVHQAEPDRLFDV